ncbi:MAG: thymidine kinase [Planctomycetes bacterium]|nr:thymidine kinase [Planctomycetota bacterium]
MPSDAGHDAGAGPSPGGVILICGCMFSGKTEELLRRIRRLPPAEVAVFKHARDDRYATDRVVTHRQDGCQAVPVWRAAEIPPLVNAAHRLVAIDEGHFFDTELAEVCAGLARSGRRVLVTALDANSWGRPFAVVQGLRRVVGAEILRTAACARCGRTATCTQRRTPIIDGGIVGGPEAFEPRCRACWSPPPEPSVD